MSIGMSIGMIYAICDHHEMSTGSPIPAGLLKLAANVDRKQLRELVRKGRLAEYDIKNYKGQVEKGYARPKKE